MKVLKFKTNIRDKREADRLSEFLGQEEGISGWDVDPDGEYNVLSVSGENPSPQQVGDAVRMAGFHAEVLRVLGTGGEGL